MGKIVIGDPTYFPERCKKGIKVIRSMCILSHPIPSTNNSNSCQIIIPQNQVGRKSDIYISCLNFSHNVCADGKYMGMVSCVQETNQPPEKGIAHGIGLLGKVDKQFTYVSDYYEPITDGKDDGIFVT